MRCGTYLVSTGRMTAPPSPDNFRALFFQQN